MDITEQSIISLCTGMRGLEKGIEFHTRLRVLSFVEIEAFILENLVRQMEQGVLAPAPLWSNLKTFPWERFHKRVHGITGGFPCQPFSVAGNRLGSEDPRHLWPYIEHGMEAVRPIWGFFENVPGHLINGYEQVRESLQKLGYTVEEGIFSAEEVGAPHLRKRLFILAVDNTALRRLKPEHIFRAGRDAFEFGQGQLQQERTVGEVRQRSGDGSEELGNSENINARTRTWQNEQIQSGRSSTKLEDSTGQGLQIPGQEGLSEFCQEGEPVSDRPEQSSSLMADPDCQQRGEQQRQQGGDGERSRNESSGSGNVVADTDIRGQQSRNDPRMGRLWQPVSWPLPPGARQGDYEHPRTTESRLGYTINGYNYREDLLRMAGNGVVEQSASLAWVLLWKKIFEL